MVKTATFRLENAWMLTWEGTSGPAVDDERRIIAILPARRSTASVEQLVETLYCRTVETAFEMARSANKRRARIASYRHTGGPSDRIFYGRNPCIFARLVIQLSVVQDGAGGTEVVRWMEPPVYGNADIGSGIKEIWPERRCEITRGIRPLAD
jgi:hypothetical protein